MGVLWNIFGTVSPVHKDLVGTLLLITCQSFSDRIQCTVRKQRGVIAKCLAFADSSAKAKVSAVLNTLCRK